MLYTLVNVTDIIALTIVALIFIIIFSSDFSVFGKKRKKILADAAKGQR